MGAIQIQIQMAPGLLEGAPFVMLNGKGERYLIRANRESISENTYNGAFNANLAQLYKGRRRKRTDPTKTESIA